MKVSTISYGCIQSMVSTHEHILYFRKHFFQRHTPRYIGMLTHKNLWYFINLETQLTPNFWRPNLQFYGSNLPKYWVIWVQGLWDIDAIICKWFASPVGVECLWQCCCLKSIFCLKGCPFREKNQTPLDARYLWDLSTRNLAFQIGFILQPGNKEPFDCAIICEQMLLEESKSPFFHIFSKNESKWWHFLPEFCA